MAIQTKTYKLPGQTKKVGSGDAKIAAFKAGSSSTSMPTPKQYNDIAEEKKATQQTPQQPQPSTQTPGQLPGMAISPMMQQVAQSSQLQPSTPTGGLSSTVYTYPSPVSPDYAQRVQMGALAAGIRDNRTAPELRRDIVQSQGTLSYIPGQKTDAERLRELDKMEAAQAMQLGKYESYAASYEEKVQKTLLPLTASGYKSARFIGGVAEGIAYTPSAVPRLAVGLVSNPGATIRETILGTSEQIISDPARGTGQLVGAAIAGKGIGKGAVKAGQVTNKAITAVKPGMRSFAANEAASVNYWQVKYDFNKPRVNAFESDVPQIQPGMGLVSGKQYSGLNPILEARIRSQGATPGVKAYADMTALERFQASKPVKPIEAPASAPANVPKITDPIKLNQLLAGDKVAFVDAPIKTLPGSRTAFKGLPEIEPTQPRIVGIKRYSNAPLSEPPAGFLESRPTRPGMWQSDLRFKANVEPANTPQLQLAPKAAKAKPTTFKEPAASTLTKGELARLQQLVNGETLPAVKALPRTRTAPLTLATIGLNMFARPASSPMTRTAAMTSPFTRAVTQPATLTAPDVNVKALARAITAPMTQTAPSTLTRPATTTKPMTSFGATASPRIKVPPILEDSTNKRRNGKRSRTTKAAFFTQQYNPLRDAKDLFGIGLRK